MSPEALKLLAGLDEQRSGNRRQRLESIVSAYYRAFPERRERADSRDEIRRLLGELEQTGALTLPKGEDCWQTMPQPALPLWIQWPPGPQKETTKLDHRKFPWVAGMQFVAALPALRNPEAARSIHEFLKAGGQSRPMVPIKERSWELFGDEKAMDSIRKGPLFAPRRLTLGHLRCFEVPTSLPCRPGPLGATGPWLIVENEATFDSFARWNKETRRHGGIILGSGLAVLRAESFLCEVMEANEAEYFGDLDERGCQIPYELNRKLTENGSGEIRPAIRYYEWLLEACNVLDGIPTTGMHKPWLKWFPLKLRDRVLHATQMPKPPPQEAIGWEWLISRAI